MNNILIGQGYQTFSPTTEFDIYSLARKEEPSLIFLDIWLAGIDGVKIAQELKNDDRTKDIPIIMMSANTQTEKLSQSVKTDGFLLKPFTIEELLSVLQRYSK